MSDSINGSSRNRAWTLTGPYGTGKSSFAIYTAQLLNRRKANGTGSAVNILKGADPELATILGVSQKGQRGLIPIPVTGTREPIEIAILRGLESALDSRLNGSRSALRSELKKTREGYARGKLVGGRRVTELVSDGIARLCKQSRTNDGVFLIIDELGKLLEYANHHSATSDLFTLQELAEQFVRSDHRCILMGILHQDFGAYANRLAPQERKEWDKVRGRFEDIVFEEPAEEMLRLIASARSNNGIVISPSLKKTVRKLGEEAWDLRLAPGTMEKREFLDVIDKCAPMHPLVTISIGTVFRRLAQNERSAFSFLSSSEPFGLNEFSLASENTSLYGIDRLYDYLSLSIRDSLYQSPQSRMWAECEDILRTLSVDGHLEDIFLVKAIGLINTIARDERIRASKNVLSFASKGCLKNDVGTKEFKRILTKKIVVERKFNNTLALWEGSDVDIDNEIRIAGDQIDVQTSVALIAERYFKSRPIVARRHSFESGTLRFFNIHFITSDHIADPHENSLTIDIVLPQNAAENREAIKSAKSKTLSAQVNRLVCVPSEGQAFAKMLFELASLEYVKQHVQALEGDRSARRELAVRIEGVQNQLSVLLEEYLSPHDYPGSSKWYNRGKLMHFRDQDNLQDLLSQICDEVYNKSPRFQNELINRRQLSSAAAKARRVLIERMFLHRNEPSLGLEKAPPEKSMYLSILSQSNLHYETKDGWDFYPPQGRSQTAIKPVWSAIEKFFVSTESGSRAVSDLFDTLSRPPYGVVEGPLPILFCAALLTFENEVALYKDGTFIPSPGAPDFELLVKNPERYTIQHWHISGVRAAVYQKLAKLFGHEKPAKVAGKTQILELIRPLLRFFQSLNKYTLQTHHLSDDAIAVREALENATEPDTLLFSDLPKAVGLKPFSQTRKASTNRIDSFIDRLKNALTELQTVYDRLLDSIVASFRSAFSLNGDLASIRRTLVDRSSGLADCSGNPNFKNFVDRIRHSELEDREWLETLSSLLILSQPASWKDGDLQRFQSELRVLARIFQHVEAVTYSEDTSRKHVLGESIRIGITHQDAHEIEKVIHISDKQLSDVDKLEKLLETSLKEAGKRNDVVTLAALARIAHKRLLN